LKIDSTYSYEIDKNNNNYPPKLIKLKNDINDSTLIIYNNSLRLREGDNNLNINNQNIVKSNDTDINPFTKCSAKNSNNSSNSNINFSLNNECENLNDQ
jgi:hypothetical protein